METFKKCKEAKHMFMTITIIYIFFFYLMWCLINSWKLLSENPQLPTWKNPPTKNSKSLSPPFSPILKFFQPPPPTYVYLHTLMLVSNFNGYSYIFLRDMKKMYYINSLYKVSQPFVQYVYNFCAILIFMYIIHCFLLSIHSFLL